MRGWYWQHLGPKPYISGEMWSCGSLGTCQWRLPSLQKAESIYFASLCNLTIRINVPCPSPALPAHSPSDPQQLTTQYNLINARRSIQNLNHTPQNKQSTSIQHPQNKLNKLTSFRTKSFVKINPSTMKMSDWFQEAHQQLNCPWRCWNKNTGL